jgi:predicted MPP superfamily phosphohydrolase
MKKLLRKRPIKVLIVLLLAIVFFGVWSLFIEPNRLVLHSESITVANWPRPLDGIKIAAIGDIHGGSPFIDEAKIREVVKLTNDQKPDLIVLLGDYMVRDRFYRKPMEPEAIANVLGALKAPLGVYAVMGNHDWWFNGDRVMKAFANVKITVLENQVREIQKNGSSFWLVGLADAWTRPQHITETFSEVPLNATTLVITHNPDSFPKLPSSAQLMFAAHTHGGQVALPLLGRLVVPSDFGQRYAAGHVQENGRHLFVTTGIGTSILPIRFRVPPEVALVTVHAG